MSVATLDLAHITPNPLLPLVAEGDASAMSQLVQRFTPFVRSVVRRTGTNASTADDVVQETMLRLWRHAHRFDPARGSEPTFIAAVARNAAIDAARREACRPSTPTPELQELAPPMPSPTESVSTALAVRAALAQLTPDQHELVRLAYFEQLTQPEIAARLHLPLGTVKSRTFHALRALRALLQEAPAG